MSYYDAMAGLPEIILISAIMGLLILLSLPVVLRRQTGQLKTKLLNTITIRIPVFLIGDIFSNLSPTIYNGSLYG
jgi:hypothetical protein